MGLSFWAFVSRCQDSSFTDEVCRWPSGDHHPDEGREQDPEVTWRTEAKNHKRNIKKLIAFGKRVHNYIKSLFWLIIGKSWWIDHFYGHFQWLCHSLPESDQRVASFMFFSHCIFSLKAICILPSLATCQRKLVRLRVIKQTRLPEYGNPRVSFGTISPTGKWIAFDHESLSAITGMMVKKDPRSHHHIWLILVASFSYFLGESWFV